VWAAHSDNEAGAKVSLEGSCWSNHLECVNVVPLPIPSHATTPVASCTLIMTSSSSSNFTGSTSSYSCTGMPKYSVS
jgi:hypothetical protein